MISFITSFRAKALARDWNHHVWLLERSIISMLAQTEGESQVIVGCHEVPDTIFNGDSRVTFIPVNYPPPTRTNDDMCADKVLKLSAGSAWAIANGSTYIAFNDADDLVSNQIGSLVGRFMNCPGWYSSTEAFYVYSSKFMRFYNVPTPCSGPFLIVRSELLEFASPPFSGRWVEMIQAGSEQNYLDLLAARLTPVNILAAVGLEHFVTYSKESGWQLEPLPFSANLVINHGDSTSHVSGGVGSYNPSGAHPPSGFRIRQFLGKTKRGLLKLPSLRLITEDVRTEYSIPADQEIPARFRRQGSVFWR